MKQSLKKQIDSFVEFKQWYIKILQDFNFNYQKDCEAREFLSRILEEKSENWKLEKVLHSFKEIIQKKAYICVFGCGPSLEESVNYILSNLGKNFFNNCINLAADGAARLLTERKIQIDGIFTDLDGVTKRDFNHSKFIIVHAHGDNIINLKHFKSEIKNFPNVIGTTQVEPVENLVNSGGFTDGDRILSFISSLLLPKHELYLIGMDFNDIIGKYSKPEIQKNHKASPIKLKKLQYALQIIEWLLNRIQNPVYIINSKITSDNLKNLTLEMFKEKILEN
ncbi:MAG: 6-hydroxymethylpterin diphosphokinase MptE-like protein [Promethearchaeota archaeon]